MKRNDTAIVGPFEVLCLKFHVVTNETRRIEPGQDMLTPEACGIMAIPPQRW